MAAEKLGGIVDTGGYFEAAKDDDVEAGNGFSKEDVIVEKLSALPPFPLSRLAR